MSVPGPVEVTLAGIGPLIDGTDARRGLIQAESQNIQAIVDFKVAEARIRQAIGA